MKKKYKIGDIVKIIDGNSGLWSTGIYSEPVTIVSNGTVGTITDIHSANASKQVQILCIFGLLWGYEDCTKLIQL